MKNKLLILLIILLLPVFCFAGSDSYFDYRQAVTDENATVTIVSTTYQRIKQLTIYNEGAADVFIGFGTGTPGVTATDARLPAENAITFQGLNSNILKVSVITAAGTATVDIHAILVDWRLPE